MCFCFWFSEMCHFTFAMISNVCPKIHGKTKSLKVDHQREVRNQLTTFFYFEYERKYTIFFIKWFMMCSMLIIIIHKLLISVYFIKYLRINAKKINLKKGKRNEVQCLNRIKLKRDPNLYVYMQFCDWKATNKIATCIIYNK